MKWRWLAITSASAVMTACSMPPPCPEAGVIATKDTCYYYETVTAKDDDKKQVTSTVAKSVIEEDKSYMTNKMNDLDTYRFNAHIFQVPDSEYSELRVGQSYMFVNEPGKPGLKLCRTTECKEAIKKFEPYEPKTRAGEK